VNQQKPLTGRPERRRIKIGGALLAALSSGLMIIILLALQPIEALPADIRTGIGNLGQLLIQLVAVTAAIAVGVGLLNLVRSQARSLRRFPNNLYSLITLIVLVGIIGLRVFERLNAGSDANPTQTSLILMDTLQVTVESALAGILFFFLVYSGYRLLRRRFTLWSALFVLAAVIVLIGYSPLAGAEFLTTIREWMLTVPVSGGMRGLLIGVALGVVVVGARLFIGGDRTFRE